MGILFVVITIVIFPLVVGVLSHLWSILNQKKRHNNLFYNQLQPFTIQHFPSHTQHTRSKIKLTRMDMEENGPEQKPIRRKASLQNLDAEEAQKQSNKLLGQAQQTSPTSLKKSSSTRTNCLCSPTTHVGSFRCRLHRHGPTYKTNMRRGHSVGSNLSDLAHKFSSHPTLGHSTLQTSASSSQMQ